MKIGLLDADNFDKKKVRFPNLALMKISAWHKARSDSVSMWFPLEHYDRVYVSKVFGDEYTQMPDYPILADEVIYGGTGFAIDIENGREAYHKERDSSLPDEIEHIYPDYDLYPEVTKNTAYGFLTRGCCNNCSFCLVSQKEGRCSHKVADLSEFWRGQRYIKLLDPNLLACPERLDLLRQLADSEARVDFTQGLDARFMTEEIAEAICKIKIETIHFAFDFMKNEAEIRRGLEIFKRVSNIRDREATVYMLTNYDTTIQEDLYRIREIIRLGYQPDVRIYRKPTAPQFLKDLQRWCNNRILFRSSMFEDYIPRVDGRSVKEIYKDVFKEGEPKHGPVKKPVLS